MKKKITVPDSWSEITVGKFQEIACLDKESKDYAINLVAILLDEDTEDVRRYDKASANKIESHLEWVVNYPSEDAYKQEIIVGDQTLRLIENLNGFSNGEWFDMEDCLQNKYEQLHYLLAMFYRPLGEQYSAEKCKERAQLIADKALISDVYGCLVFFSIVARKSMLTTQAYLWAQIQKTSEKTLKNSKSKVSGPGMDSIIPLHAAI